MGLDNMTELIQKVLSDEFIFVDWGDDDKYNVASTLAHIVQKTAQNKAIEKALIYKDLLVSPSRRNAFIGNAPLALTRQEFGEC